MSEAPSEEKTDEPSERKLQKLRDDGIVASSQIGTNFIGFAVGFAVAAFLLTIMIDRINEGFDLVFDALGNRDVTDSDLLNYFLLQMHMPIAAVMAAIIAASIFFKMLVHGGFIISLKHVEPKLDKVSPIGGLKKLFKGRILTEFLATTIRFGILALVFGLLAWSWGPILLNLDLCVPSCAADVSWRVMRSVVITCSVLLIVSVAFDVGIQRAFFLHEQRMTKTEVKKEQKEMLGQPEIRQERRRLQRDNTALAGVVGVAAVTVYFNYGDRVVALAFDPVKVPLPKVAAKSRKAAETVNIIQSLSNRGVPGMEDEAIVMACEMLPVGSNVPRSIFMPLAKHLREMMG